MTSKITRLSPTEVANNAPLAFDKKRQHLEKIQKLGVGWGYQPVIAALPKLLLAGSSLFGDLPSGNDKYLLEQISKACKRGEDQRAGNLAVADAIIKWRDENNVRGEVVSIEPYRSTLDTISFCANVAVIIDGKLVVIFLDCRSSMSLKANGREFVKSLIHHTALIGDLKDASVAILRVPKISNGKRKAIFEYLEGEPKYSHDQIDALVMETYTLWELILRARREASAKEASSGGNVTDLFG